MEDGSTDVSPPSQSPRPPPPRVYRAGLGLPEAVVIRSGPAPSHSKSTTIIDGSAILDPPPPAGITWREWTINPAKHGPERMTRPPVFVPSQMTYDELGRSMDDGVDVSVEEGKSKAREVEEGEKVAEWYVALSRSGSGASTPTSIAGPSKRRQDLPTVKNDIIDMTDEIEDTEEASIQPPINTTATPIEPAPVRVHRREWFIRRALLRASQSSDNSSPVPPPHPPSKPSSIGSLLNITPQQPRVNLPQYVLGPENRGYALLKDRLGWQGGGLGRPQGWRTPEPPVKLEIPQSSAQAKSRAESSGVMTNDVPNLVDLTGDSESEEEDVDIDLPDPKRLGPGRTAPIATALKLDRLGIGHGRNTERGTVEASKKVTHSAKEIAKARRRARYAGQPRRGLVLGKTGKIKWKEKDKKEREDRRRLVAALND